MNPGEKQGKTPRFHRGQIVVREWTETGAKEHFLVLEFLREEWYFCRYIEHGYEGKYNLTDHSSENKRFNCVCKPLNEV